MTEAHGLRGKWALVTGAGRRVGAAIARTLHGEGASVAIHYRNSAVDAEALARELNALRPGEHALHVPLPRPHGFENRIAVVMDFLATLLLSRC